MIKLTFTDYKDAKSLINDFINELDNKDFLYSNAHNPIIPLLLKDIFGYEPVYHIYLNEDTEKVLGFITGVLFKNKFISIPHFSFAGLVSIDESLTNKFISTINRSYFIRSIFQISPYFSNEKIISFLSLEKGYDFIYKSLKYNIRRQIRIAQDNGLLVKMGRKELLKDFLFVYYKNMQRLGSPPLPKRFFERIIEGWENGEVIVICTYHNDNPIGCSFLLSYGNVIENCWAGFLSEYNKLYTPYITYIEMIKYAAENNYKFFSFGRSSQDSGSLAFKKHWNPDNKYLYYNYSSKKNGSIINNSLLKKLYKRYSNIWLNNVIGKVISKYVY